jgi:hypothetical protein
MHPTTSLFETCKKNNDPRTRWSVGRTSTIRGQTRGGRYSVSGFWWINAVVVGVNIGSATGGPSDELTLGRAMAA